MDLTPDNPPRRTVRLGPGSEFDRIRGFIARGAPVPNSVRVGPGDDAAVLEGGWVVSTDVAVEDVHFRRAWLSDREIGYRAAMAALSDLAAVAAEPVGLFVSLAVSGGDAVADEVHRGIEEAAYEVGAAVLGGDLSRSPGPLFVDITALGRTPWPILRNGAEPKDEVWVTGRLGGSATAVHAWRAGEEPSPEARAAFARPQARLQEALCLAEQETVDALIDLSDGLAGDAGHLAAASGVRIVLDESAIPIAPAALESLGPEEALRAALHGGEDYELCFVTDPGVMDPAGFESRFGVPVTRIGVVEDGEGVWLRREWGSPERLDHGGFDHFGDDA